MGRAWLHDHIIRRPVTAAILSFGTLAFGAVLSVWPKEIADSTRLVVTGPRNGVDIPVVAFWVAVIFWTVVLYYRLKSDDAVESARFAQLTSAIHMAPDYGIFSDYPDYYDRAASAIGSTHTPGESDAVRLINLTRGIRLVLEITAAMAAKFRAAGSETSYGANVMLVAKPPFASELVDHLRFFDTENFDANALRAILYLPKALLVSEIGRGPPRRIPSIALPVPKRERDARGNRLALPGAPWAFLTGTQSAELDTAQMASQCAGLPASVIAEVSEYFSQVGAGAQVGSFVSFRLGNEKVPLGVLNIDCDKPNVLGLEREYYPTFYALITPIVRLLAKPIAEYAQITSARGEFFGG